MASLASRNPTFAPDVYTFQDQTGVPLSTVITSAGVTVSGLIAGVTTPLTVVNGTADINGSGNFSTSPGLVKNGDVVRARTTSGSSSSTSVDVIVSIGGQIDTFTVTTVSVNTVKWNPGDMVGASHNFGSENITTCKARWDLMRTHPEFKHGYLVCKWRDLETAQGVYDFSLIQQSIDYLNNTTIPGRFSTPKGLIVEPWVVKFTVPVGNPYTGTQPCPDYVISNGWVKVVPHAWEPTLYADTYADFEIAGCRNAYIAMLQALLAYFDANPSFEGLEIIGETAQQSLSSLGIIATAVKPYGPHTNVFVAHNWQGDAAFAPGTKDANFKDLMVSLKVGLGGPDMGPFTTDNINPPTLETDGQLAFRGAGTINGYAYGTVDSRGVVPNKLGREVPNNLLSGQGDDSQVAQYCVTQKVTHRHWWFDNDAGDYNGHASFNQLLSVINAYPAWSGYPTAYSTNSFALNDAANGRYFQRTGVLGNVPVSGTYSGTATDVQARVLNFNTSAEVVTWTTVASSLTGGTWSGTIPSVPQGGPYKFEIRLRNGGTVLSTVTGTSSWYVGAIFGLIGSSTPELWASDYGGGGLTATASEFNSGIWQNYGVGNWHTPKGPGVISFLNAVYTELGCPVAMVPFGASGTTLAAWNDGMSNISYSNFILNGVNQVGGKLEAVVCIVGLNDAPSIVSRASHLADLRLLRDTLRTDLGQPTLKWFQLASQRYGAGTDAKFNFLHQAETDFGADANTYLASSIGIPQESDQLHPTYQGMIDQGKRVALLVADAIGDDTFSRGPTIGSVANVDATHTDVTITHRGGTDFTPASSITGFQISDNAWAGTLAISAAARQSATSIRLTHAAAGATRVVRYMWGAYPVDTGYVKDNTALALPLEFNAD